MFRLALVVVLALAALAACDGHRRGIMPVCVAGSVCDTGNPCQRASVQCDAARRPHCLVTEVAPNCPPAPARACIAGAICDTGNPYARGRIVCGVDDTAHCIADRWESAVPPPYRACVAGAVCDSGDPCIGSRVRCGADGRSHCVATARGNRAAPRRRRRPACPTPSATPATPARTGARAAMPPDARTASWSASNRAARADGPTRRRRRPRRACASVR